MYKLNAGVHYVTMGTTKVKRTIWQENEDYYILRNKNKIFVKRAKFGEWVVI